MIAVRADSLHRSVRSLLNQHACIPHILVVANEDRVDPEVVSSVSALPGTWPSSIKRRGSLPQRVAIRSVAGWDCLLRFLDDDDEYLPDTLALAVGGA